MSQRRFTDKADLDPTNVMELPASHNAMRENRTLFPNTVVEITQDAPERLFISGQNNRKLGKTIEKGSFKGYALYGFSLEERATCPTSCGNRSICYGNGMQLARRHRIGDADVFYERAEDEIAELIETHGAVMLRLHVLGDFPNIFYVAFWKDMLVEYPKLAIYGYTHRREDSEIGQAIAALKVDFPERFRIRWSHAQPGPDRATTIKFIPDTARVGANIVCPAQTDATGCCSTCGLCWEPSAQARGILFVAHGRTSLDSAAQNAMAAIDAAADTQVRQLRTAAQHMRAKTLPEPLDEAAMTAEERVEMLESVLEDDSWIPSDWKLAPSEAKLLNLLIERKMATKEAVHTMFYGMDVDGGAEMKIVDVFVCKLRAKLIPRGLKIETARGQGYYLDDNSRAMLQGLKSGRFEAFADLDSALAKADMRPIIGLQLPKTLQPATDIGDRPEFKMVRITDLRVEPSYQRDLSGRSVAMIRKIVANWDWAKFKPPVCFPAGDGLYYVVDGQHTAIAAASHPALHALPVMIVKADTVQKRAASFVAHNRDRVRMADHQIFRAEAKAGIGEAAAIMRLIEESGATLPRYNIASKMANVGDIVTITPLKIAFNKGGADLVRRILSIAVAARCKPINATVLSGLRILVETDEFAGVAVLPDAEIVAAILAIADIEAAAVQNAPNGKNRYIGFARAVTAQLKVPVTWTVAA